MVLPRRASELALRAGAVTALRAFELQPPQKNGRRFYSFVTMQPSPAAAASGAGGGGAAAGPPSHHPVSRPSAETSDSEPGVEGASLYHDTLSKPSNDGDLFDEHDKITRFLFQVPPPTPSPPSSMMLTLSQPHSVTIIFVFFALLFHTAFGSLDRESPANALLGIKASAICFLLSVRAANTATLPVTQAG
jgi:hypothetical protein